MVVKTAVSLNRELFRKGEALAAKLRMSRSQLLARALEEFIQRRENDELLRRLNAAYADGPDEQERRTLDAARIQHWRRLKKDKW
jgi:metal-responsive CopG/Arc/MetJ family transcriptional regulator